MAPAQAVEMLNNLTRSHTLAIDCHTIALLKIQINIFRLVRSFRRIHRQLEHFAILGSSRVKPWVFQNASLVRNVPKIPIHRIWFLQGSLHRNTIRTAPLDHFTSSRKGLTELGHSPRCDHLKIGSKSGKRQLKAHLVVAFTSRSVRNMRGAFLPGDINLRLCDERTRDRSAEEVLALVDRVAANHRIDIVTGKLVHEIQRIMLAGSR
ncbi:MAG: hypothetical protein BWY82_00994 [Verrucomicrobia bacterium ADurb.Bin474]|nr:MAG: hypothetical protein BWY82_00994 [Verrucomicrobia bacterium ADurb.Bin474]